MGEALELVVERASGCSRPSAVRDQPVGEPDVLGQQRAVQIGADHVAGAGALDAVDAVVAVAAGARGRAARAPGPRCVRPPWFSKPASTAARRRRASTSIATLPIRRGPSERTVRSVQQPDARQRLARPARSSARAAGSRRRPPSTTAPARGRVAARSRLCSARSRGAQLLVAILAAADVVEVGAVGVERRRRARSRSARTRSRASGSGARASAGCRGRRRCSSGRDTARRRAVRGIRHRASPPRCRRARPSARIRRTASGRSPACLRLGLQVPDGDDDRA